MGICTKCGAEMQPADRYCKKCGAGGNRAQDLEEKKARVLAGERKWIRPVIITAGTAFVLLAAWVMYLSINGANPVATSTYRQYQQPVNPSSVQHAGVTAHNGVIKIAISTLPENGARFFSYSSDQKRINFFLLKSPDGSIRAALDACNACYRAKLGYRYENGVMVCNNCGMMFRPQDIGMIAGGCNPIPVQKIEESGVVVLKVRDLEAGAKYF